MRKYMKIFLILVCIVVLIFVILIMLDLENKKKKANDMAVRYLESVYTEQMEPVNVRLSFIDAALCHVYFTPKSNPELVFEVVIMLDFSPPVRNSSDDYLLSYFEFHFVNNLQSMINDLINEETTIRIDFLHQPIYGFIVPEELKEGMTYQEMEPYIDYEVYINMNKEWMDANKHTEACRMLEVIDIIQKSGYTPKEICFCYKTKKTKEYFVFSEWDSINNVSQVEELLE